MNNRFNENWPYNRAPGNNPLARRQRARHPVRPRPHNHNHNPNHNPNPAAAIPPADLRAMQRTLTQQAQQIQALEQAVHQQDLILEQALNYQVAALQHIGATLAQHTAHLHAHEQPLQPLLKRIHVLDGRRAEDARHARHRHEAGYGGSIELDLWLLAQKHIEDPHRARRWGRRFHHLYGYRYQDVRARTTMPPPPPLPWPALDARVAAVFNIHADLMVAPGVPGRLALLDRCRALLGVWVDPARRPRDWMAEGSESRGAYEGIVGRFRGLMEASHE
ncbi:hypothetical protein BP00DRAFT_452179 [Aspergillus indologenus CBS 114.80]|uniref:Uncharacterized protein n=1 Tax=Aspergillus indologenus CBS 114.80 TaxID=1450541 RepID=A0A2V5HUT1_9EURO|nr:hypothetical protein BP00DRAFT_452179 [Aspergillus indologenus CBS 114.80]